MCTSSFIPKPITMVTGLGTTQMYTWNGTHWPTQSLLASFPGLPQLLFLIACSMQKQEGEGLMNLVEKTVLLLAGSICSEQLHSLLWGDSRRWPTLIFGVPLLRAWQRSTWSNKRVFTVQPFMIFFWQKDTTPISDCYNSCDSCSSCSHQHSLAWTFAECYA